VLPIFRQWSRLSQYVDCSVLTPIGYEFVMLWQLPGPPAWIETGLELAVDLHAAGLCVYCLPAVTAACQVDPLLGERVIALMLQSQRDSCWSGGERRLLSSWVIQVRTPQPGRE
jgi:hypothetical protein